MMQSVAMKNTRQPSDIIYIRKDCSSKRIGSSGPLRMKVEFGKEMFQVPLTTGSVTLTILVGSTPDGGGGGGGGVGTTVGLSLM